MRLAPKETLTMSIVARRARILIADDFAPWRDQLRSLLKERPEWNVIAEASDGKEAIGKASQTQPDIVLLDVGMPFLNGIEAAKIIHQRCPKTKILFVTQDGDTDLKKAAMRAVAAGYVVKANAAHDLLDAIATALGR